MTRNLQTTIKITLPIIQYDNQTTKPKIKQKNGFKKPHVNTILPQFLALSNQQKNHSLLAPLFNSIQDQNHSKIFHAFHFLLQNSLKLK